MRSTLAYSAIAFLLIAAPAAALTVGGGEYGVGLDGTSLGLDSGEATGAPDAPVGVAAGASVDHVAVSGDAPTCTVQAAELQQSGCHAAAPHVEVAAPTLRHDVRVALPFATAAPAPVQDPSLRELVAYNGEYELTLPQLATAVAAAGAATGLAYALWRALRTGGLLALVPLATHLRPNELLNDPHRKAIHDLIRAEPGIATKDIADRLGLAWGTVTHHLLKLEKARYVVSQKFGKYRRYFVNGSGIEQKERVAVLKVARTGDVVEFVRANPGASQKAVSESMGVSSSTVLWHVKRLIKVGMIHKVRDGKSVRYYVPETTDRTLATPTPVRA